MKRIGPIIIVSLLVFAAPAAGKGVSSASVCGAAGCKDVEGERLLIALSDAGNYSDPPAAGSPWFRAHVTFHSDGHEEEVSFVVVPEEQKLRTEDGTWTSMLPEHVEEYQAMVRGLDPFPASKLAGVDPSFASSSPAPAAPDDGGGLGAGWIAGGVLALLLAAGALLALRRRRQAGSGEPGLGTTP